MTFFLLCTFQFTASSNLCLEPLENFLVTVHTEMSLGRIQNSLESNSLLSYLGYEFWEQLDTSERELWVKDLVQNAQLHKLSSSAAWPHTPEHWERLWSFTKQCWRKWPHGPYDLPHTVLLFLILAPVHHHKWLLSPQIPEAGLENHQLQRRAHYVSLTCWFPKQWAKTIGAFKMAPSCSTMSICWIVQKLQSQFALCVSTVFLQGADSSASDVHQDSTFFLLNLCWRGTPLPMLHFHVIKVCALFYSLFHCPAYLSFSKNLCAIKV